MSGHRMRLLLPFILICASVSVLIGCKEEKKSTMANVDPETFPTMSTADVSTMISDSGYIRYHLSTDLWLVYDEAAEPRWVFPVGINMDRYDDTLGIESTFVADSATYMSAKRIWQFDGNVRMKKVNGDSFETEQLFWDQNRNKVYSDSFIHIERVDRILEGYGFVSNEELTEYTILDVSGIFPVPEKKGQKERPEADAETADTITTETGNTLPRRRKNDI